MMKVAQVITKTISAADAAALDVAVAAYTRTLREQVYVDSHFTVIAGQFILVLVHTA